MTPSDDPDNADDAAIVKAAFDALPAPATAGFGVRLTAMEGDVATFEALLPAGAKAIDLFLAGSDDYAFETPKRIDTDGKVLFLVKATRPKAVPASGALSYTLVSDHGAVSGTVPFF